MNAQIHNVQSVVKQNNVKHNVGNETENSKQVPDLVKSNVKFCCVRQSLPSNSIMNGSLTTSILSAIRNSRVFGPALGSVSLFRKHKQRFFTFSFSLVISLRFSSEGELREWYSSSLLETCLGACDAELICFSSMVTHNTGLM